MCDKISLGFTRSKPRHITDPLRDSTAQDTLVGIELMHMIKKRQMVVDAEDEGRTAAELFSSLAASTPLRQGHLSLHGPPVQHARQSPLQRLSLLNDEYVVGVKNDRRAAVAPPA